MRTPKKLMDAARDEECTLNLQGVCNYSPETVVACHLPDGTGGSNKLTGPLSVAFGCHDCHAIIDGRNESHLFNDHDLEFYMRRGMMRTMTRLVDRGILKW